MIQVGNKSFMTIDEFVKQENEMFPKFIEAPLYSSDEEKSMIEAIIKINDKKQGVIKYLCNEVNAKYISALHSILDKEPVTQSSNPRVFNAILDVVKNLGIQMPNIYMYNANDVRSIPWKSLNTIVLYPKNAFTMGTREMLYVFISEEIIDDNKLKDDEIKALIGHEIGHAFSNHLVYQEIFEINNIEAAEYLSIDEIKQIRKYYENNYFSRCNEITADRAGLIACRNLDAITGMLDKINGEDGWGYNHSSATHPNGYARIEAIKSFANSQLYARCISRIDETPQIITPDMISDRDLSDIVENLIKKL